MLRNIYRMKFRLNYPQIRVSCKKAHSEIPSSIYKNDWRNTSEVKIKNYISDFQFILKKNFLNYFNISPSDLTELQLFDQYIKKDTNLVLNCKNTAYLIKYLAVYYVNSLRKSPTFCISNVIIIDENFDKKKEIMDIFNQVKGISAVYIPNGVDFQEANTILNNKIVDFLIISDTYFLEINKNCEIYFSDNLKIISIIENLERTERFFSEFNNLNINYYYLINFRENRLFDAIKKKSTKFGNSVPSYIEMVMSVNYFTVCYSSPKVCQDIIDKFLSRSENIDKKVLIVYDKKMIDFNDFIEFFNLRGFSNKIQSSKIYLEKDDLENQAQKFKGIFDLVIEIPLDNVKYLTSLDYYINPDAFFNEFQIVSFFPPEDLEYVVKQKQVTRNIFIRDINFQKLTFQQNLNNIELKVALNESGQTKELYKHFLEYLDSHREIENKIIEQFYFKFKSSLNNTKYNSTSLLSGKQGYFTCQLTPPNNMQNDDRYYIPKLILREKLATLENYNREIFRIFDSMDYIIDIAEDRFEDFLKIAKIQDIEVQKISELPDIFINPHQDFKDFLKINIK